MRPLAAGDAPTNSNLSGPAASVRPKHPFSYESSGGERNHVHGDEKQAASAINPRRSSSNRSAIEWLSSAKNPKAETAGGIVLPDTAKDKPARGTVISVGEGRLLDDGRRHPLQVKPGDRVIFSSYAGEQFKIGEQELLLMREEDILAVVE